MPESVVKALNEWSAITTEGVIPFGGAEFKFSGFTPKITPVDLWKEAGQGLRAYINTIKGEGNPLEPIQAMIISVNEQARLMAVRYDFEDKDVIFLHDLDPIEPGIFISGESTPELVRWINGFRLDTGNPGAKTMFTMRDSGEGTLTLYPETMF